MQPPATSTPLQSPIPLFFNSVTINMLPNMHNVTQTNTGGLHYSAMQAMINQYHNPADLANSAPATLANSIMDTMDLCIQDVITHAASMTDYICTLQLYDLTNPYAMPPDVSACFFYPYEKVRYIVMDNWIRVRMYELLNTFVCAMYPRSMTGRRLIAFGTPNSVFGLFNPDIPDEKYTNPTFDKLLNQYMAVIPEMSNGWQKYNHMPFNETWSDKSVVPASEEIRDIRYTYTFETLEDKEMHEYNARHGRNSVYASIFNDVPVVRLPRYIPYFRPRRSQNYVMLMKEKRFQQEDHLLHLMLIHLHFINAQKHNHHSAEDDVIADSFYVDRKDIMATVTGKENWEYMYIHEGVLQRFQTLMFPCIV